MSDFPQAFAKVLSQSDRTLCLIQLSSQEVWMRKNLQLNVTHMSSISNQIVTIWTMKLRIISLSIYSSFVDLAIHVGGFVTFLNLP